MKIGGRQRKLTESRKRMTALELSAHYIMKQMGEDVKGDIGKPKWLSDKEWEEVCMKIRKFPAMWLFQ